MILQIFNKIPGHYEIIESIIVKYRIIIGKKNIKKIFLKVHNWDKSFSSYIKKKYPHIEFGITDKYDYHINCSAYPKHYDMISKVDNKKYFFIGHDIDMFLRKMENVFFLTPLAKRFLYADVMPHMTKKNMNTEIPIYIVQGHFGGDHARRRNMNLLLKILQFDFKKKFILKFVGTGKIPEEFEPYKHKIEFIQGLNFDDYHKQFLDCYAIFTLTLKDTNFQYYKTKLTSTINYIRGYKLKAIIDKDLQDIYKLKDVELYSNENNFLSAFKRSLNDFYSIYVNKKNKLKNEEKILENKVTEKSSENDKEKSSINNKEKSSENDKEKSSINNKEKSSINNKEKSSENDKEKSSENDKEKSSINNKEKSSENNKEKSSENDKEKSSINDQERS